MQNCYKIKETQTQQLANKKLGLLHQYINTELIRPNQGNNLYFFTMHYKEPKTNIDSTKENIRQFMSALHLQLRGYKWHKPCNLYPGLTIIEHGKTGFYHPHTILNICEKTTNDLQIALNKVSTHSPWFSFSYIIYDNANEIDRDSNNFENNKNHLDIRKVWDSNSLIYYMTKQYNFRNNKVNFDNFYPHQLLFDKTQISKPGWRKSKHIIRREYQQTKKRLNCV